MGGPVLFEHLSDQLARLCEVAGTDAVLATGLLSDLLGHAGLRPLSQPPPWPSEVADDHTPIEFSIAFTPGERPAVRILGEALGPRPAAAENLAAAHGFLDAQAHRFGLTMSRFERVRDLFTTKNPRGTFGIWHSIILRNGRQPEFKVYLNPEIGGVARAPALVAEALRRLGLAGAYQTTLDHGVRPGELGRRDRMTFFALDLRDGPRARVKVYLTHHGADAQDVVRAAGAVDGTDAAELVGFCETVGGGAGPFDGRPLVSSYTFFEGVDRPVGYSVYLPVRSYVGDDDEARDRVVAVLDRYGFDHTEFDRAIGAVTRRRLGDGVGLIAHASLRLGPPRPGVSVYLSSEAYRVSPPRQRPGAATGGPGRRPTDRSLADRSLARHL
jgi:DMATS type aromatic prenyltransferase